MIRKLMALATSDTASMVLAVAAVGWGIGKLQKLVEQGQNTIVALDREIGARQEEIRALYAERAHLISTRITDEDLDRLAQSSEEQP